MDRVVIEKDEGVVESIRDEETGEVKEAAFSGIGRERENR